MCHSNKCLFPKAVFRLFFWFVTILYHFLNATSVAIYYLYFLPVLKSTMVEFQITMLVRHVTHWWQFVFILFSLFFFLFGWFCLSWIWIRRTTLTVLTCVCVRGLCVWTSKKEQNLTKQEELNKMFPNSLVPLSTTLNYCHL